MNNAIARTLVTRRPDELMRELHSSVSPDTVSVFINSSSAIILAITGVNNDIKDIITRHPGIVSLVGEDSRILISASYNLLHNLAEYLPDPEVTRLIRSALKNQQPLIYTNSKMPKGLGKRTLIMGILNATPDSFSDGGEYNSLDNAVEHALQMLEDGADIIDIGGESTRPGAIPVDAQEEIQRVVPVIKALRKTTEACISIDTHKAIVAEAACDAGANMINDVSSGTLDAEMPDVASRSGCPVILMHMRGTPQTMQAMTDYANIMEDIYMFLNERIDCFIEAGCNRDSMIVDPGFGFGKTPEQNLEILRRLAELKNLGCPLLIGTSRKSTIGKILGDVSVNNRLEGTAATVAIAIANGADIVRVHDVQQMARVAKMSDAIARNK